MLGLLEARWAVSRANVSVNMSELKLYFISHSQLTGAPRGSDQAANLGDGNGGRASSLFPSHIPLSHF